MNKLDQIRRRVIDRLTLGDPVRAIDSQHQLGISAPFDDWAVLAHEYNDVVDQQERLRQSTFLFPMEIMIECFRHAIDADPNFVYTLVLLNRSWKELILSTPSFWSKILLDNGDEQHPWKLYTALQLSRDLPLQVTLRFSNTQLDLNLDFLILEKHRNASLIITPAVPGAIFVPRWGDMDVLSVALRTLGELPNLITLINDEPDAPDFDFTRDFPLSSDYMVLYPKLRQIVQWSVRSVELDASNLNFWESVSVREPIDTFTGDYLPRMPSLRHLYFFPAGTAAEMPKLETKKQVSNSLLQSVQCSWQSCRGDNPLFLLSSLRFLSVQFTWKNIEAFLLSIGTTLPLEHFELVISVPQSNEPFRGPDLVPKLSRIKTFSLIITDPWWYENDKSNIENLTGSLDIFIPILPELIPNTTRLTYRSAGGSPPILFFAHIQRLEKLNFLDIHFNPRLIDVFKPYGNTKKTYYMLTSIHINFFDMLRIIQAPNLVSAHLTMQNRGLPTIDGVSPSIDGFPRYSGLRELHWEPPEPPWRYHDYYRPPSALMVLMVPFVLTLHSLETLNFAPGIDIEDQHEILITMLEYPNVLPHLQRLSFSEFPSFSLLLRVLFRRNILWPMGDTADRVMEIVLPDFPCPNLLSRLAFVLAGKVAPIEVMEEPLPEQSLAVYHYHIPGCMFCFGSGHLCSATISHKDSYDDQPEGSNANGRSDPNHASQYPVNIPELAWDHGTEASWHPSESDWCKAWRKAWAERNTCLTDMPGNHRRTRACSRYAPKERVSITGSYLSIINDSRKERGRI